MPTHRRGPGIQMKQHSLFLSCSSPLSASPQTPRLKISLTYNTDTETQRFQRPVPTLQAFERQFIHDGRAPTGFQKINCTHMWFISRWVSPALSIKTGSIFITASSMGSTTRCILWRGAGTRAPPVLSHPPPHHQCKLERDELRSEHSE